MRDAPSLPTVLPPHPTVGVWTPSSPAPARFPRRFARAVAALRADGIEVRLGRHATGDDGLYAGTPPQLAEDLHALLLDDEVDAVVVATGGHTTVRVLDHVDWSLVRRAAKPIVGYSDATAFLWAALAVGRLATFHGPMVISEWGEHGGIRPASRTAFLEALTRPPDRELVLRSLGRWTDERLHWDRDDDRARTTSPGGWRALVAGEARGWLLAGCLPTASGLIGTRYFPDTSGAILCLESTGTSAEEWSALLAQWRLAGHLDRIAGLVVGRHSQVPAGTTLAELDRVVLETLAELGRPELPVLADVDFGHTDPKLTIPLGVPARLSTRGLSLTVEPCVETKEKQR